MSVTAEGQNKPGKSVSTKWKLGLVALLVVGAIALDTKVVHIGSEEDLREQAFDPDAFGIDQFPRIRALVVDRAPEATQLAQELVADKAAAVDSYGTEAGIGPVMPVQFVGTVGEGKSGIYTVTIDGVPEETTVRVQTGPAINGTDLRDFPGDIAFGQFTNQIEYQDAGSGINRAMASEVLGDIDREALSGESVSVTGVFKLINPKNWLVTPVQFEVQK